MPHSLFWPDSALMEAAGYGSVKDVPCVFDSEWLLHDAATSYLIDRALKQFSARNPSGSAAAGTTLPTERSLASFGNWLVDHLDWCEHSGRDWRTLTYANDIVNGYQQDMETGLWSRDQRPLSPSTINSRGDEASLFHRWAASRGLRSDFEVATTVKRRRADRGNSSDGHRTVETEVRDGRVKKKPKVLRLPTDSEIEKWHKNILVKTGFTKALMCELIIKTGVRLEEACRWQIDTLPLESSDWIMAPGSEYVQVTLTHGTKGSKRPGERGELLGPGRAIKMPIELARRIDSYRQFQRVANRSIYARKLRDSAQRKDAARQNPRQLFLSDHTGQPVSRQRLYEAWVEKGGIPFKGWSPHGGRHFTACKLIIGAVERTRKALSGPNPTSLTPNWLTGCASDAILLEVRPQLGHVDKETSEMYLVWLAGAFSKSAIYEEYDAFLEDIVTDRGAD
jgi:integrase